MSSNCLEHNIADLAILHTGAVPSTLYRQLKSGQIEYVADLMEAKVAFVGDSELFTEVDEAKKKCPKLEYIILFNDYEKHKYVLLEGFHYPESSYEDNGKTGYVDKQKYKVTKKSHY